MYLITIFKVISQRKKETMAVAQCRGLPHLTYQVYFLYKKRKEKDTKETCCLKGIVAQSFVEGRVLSVCRKLPVPAALCQL